MSTIGGNGTGTITMENSIKFSQEINNRLPYESVIPLLGICPNETKPLSGRNIRMPMFVAA